MSSSTASRAGRLAWMSLRTATRMETPARAGGPEPAADYRRRGCRRTRTLWEHRRGRIVAAALAAVVVAELAVLVLAPGDVGPDPADRSRPRAPSSPREIERARDYRGGQRNLFARRPRRSSSPRSACSRPGGRGGSGACSSAPARGRSSAPLAAGAGISAAPDPARAADRDLVAHERAVDVGLSTQGVGDWLGDRARAAGDRGRSSPPLGAADPRRRCSAACRAAGGLAGAVVVVLYAIVTTWLAPVVLAPIFNDFEPLPEGPRASRRARARRPRRGRDRRGLLGRRLAAEHRPQRLRRRDRLEQAGRPLRQPARRRRAGRCCGRSSRTSSAHVEHRRHPARPRSSSRSSRRSAMLVRRARRRRRCAAAPAPSRARRRRFPPTRFALAVVAFAIGLAGAPALPLGRGERRPLRARAHRRPRTASSTCSGGSP